VAELHSDPWMDFVSIVYIVRTREKKIKRTVYVRGEIEVEPGVLNFRPRRKKRMKLEGESFLQMT
jgi:hypothetical protein